MRRVAVFLSWLVAALAELALARGACDPPSHTQAVLELGLFTLLGALHAWKAPADWRGSAAWPGLLLVAGAVLRWDAPSQLLTALQWIGTPIFVIIGARVLEDALRHAPLVGILCSVVAALLGRFTVLLTTPTVQPQRRLWEQLSAPLQPTPVPLAAPPIVVLSVDTLRTGHATKTQTWAALSARGATWPRGMSTASWTLPSLASLWTGRMPSEHGAGNLGDEQFSPISVRTLPEELADAGYTTAAFVANPFVATELGFHRGFQTWVNPDEQVRQPLTLLGPPPGPAPTDGALVVNRALRWLDQAPQGGFLLWVHLFDPHLPYRHADPTSPAGRIHSLRPIRDGRQTVTPTLQRSVRAAYQAEVDYADAQAMRVLDALDRRGFFEQGTLFFTADHGEELWDHGGFEHGHSHHGEVVDVSMALVSPGLPAGPRAGVASLRDVAPTLRAVTGLPHSGLDLRQGVPPGRIATAAGNLYGAPQRSARDEHARVIVTDAEDGQRRERYLLEQDPLETAALPVPPDDPLLQAALATRTAAEGATAAQVNTDALRALGYVEPAQ